MSCCGGSCGCGSGCKCGNGCGGCGMYPVLSERSTTTFTIIQGVAPMNNSYGRVEEKAAGEGCKCGSNCTCDPCNC
ncbi:hypothetical protein HAX54_047323 [Datura stramonium]|uniref:Metallothionein-like protein n=1 Tax=Datura stramonium TaxID=4076 RepID=A0ABS8WI47_DATST|nr:hypothetical protein [Datura stramonium]